MNTWILPEQDRAEMVDRIVRFLLTTLPGKRVEVKADVYRKRRTLEQNAALFGHAYDVLRRETGNDLEDLHMHFCGEFFGWVDVDVMGVMQRKPRRSTTLDERGNRDLLSTEQFSEFFAFVQQRAAELGVFIDDPMRESA